MLPISYSTCQREASMSSGRLAAARIDFLEFGIDDVVVGRTASIAGGSGLPAGATRALRGRASQGFGNPGGCLLQTFRRLADRLYVFRCQILLHLDNGLFDLLLEVGRDLVLRLFQGLLGAVDRSIRLVARFDKFLAPLVFFGMRFGFPDHLLDIDLAQAAGCLDPDALLLSALFVLG